MKVFWILGGVFFAVGIGLLSSALVAWIVVSDFVAHASHANGVVVALAIPSGSRRRGEVPVVEFNTPDGRKIRFTGSISSNPPLYQPGNSLGVLYEVANPEHARIDTFLETQLQPLILGSMGVVFATIGGAFLGVQMRRRKIRAWLAEFGMRVQAKYAGVHYDKHYRVAGRSPWRLLCRWQHPVTQEQYLFRSDQIWFDPTPYVKRETLDVLVNADNPKQYQVDTSFLPAKS